MSSQREAEGWREKRSIWGEFMKKNIAVETAESTVEAA